jgi:hypothetical protein
MPGGVGGATSRGVPLSRSASTASFPLRGSVIRPVARVDSSRATRALDFASGEKQVDLQAIPDGDRRSFFSETASVCQAPVFPCVLALSGFSVRLCTPHPCRSKRPRRRSGPRQERGPRRRPSNPRTAILATENLKGVLVLRPLFSTSRCETVRLAEACSARSVHPSLRAQWGECRYAGA